MNHAIIIVIDRVNDKITRSRNSPGSESNVFLAYFNMVAHSEILFSKFAQFREQGEFIDVALKVREELFSAHRIVLAASSDYFHAMFAHGMKESNQEVIELKDESISAAALKIVLDSIYSGDLQVNDENVFEVLVAADHLQVKRKTSGHLGLESHFHADNSCQTRLIANKKSDQWQFSKHVLISRYFLTGGRPGEIVL